MTPIIVTMARMKARSRIRGALLLLLIAGVLLYSVSFRARSQAPCGPTAEIFALLAQTFGEHVVAEAEYPGDEGRKQVLMRNPGTGSWSLLFRWTNGVSCVVSAGHGSTLPVWL